MMPFLPIVRVPDFDAAVEAALQAEHGYRHTAVIHSATSRASRRWRGHERHPVRAQRPSTASLGVNGPAT